MRRERQDGMQQMVGSWLRRRCGGSAGGWWRRGLVMGLLLGCVRPAAADDEPAAAADATAAAAGAENNTGAVSGAVHDEATPVDKIETRRLLRRDLDTASLQQLSAARGGTLG